MLAALLFLLKLMVACSAAVSVVGFFGIRPIYAAAALPAVLISCRALAVL